MERGWWCQAPTRKPSPRFMIFCASRSRTTKPAIRHPSTKIAVAKLQACETFLGSLQSPHRRPHELVRSLVLNTLAGQSLEEYGGRHQTNEDFGHIRTARPAAAPHMAVSSWHGWCRVRATSGSESD